MLADYVLTQPPIYSGPPKPVDPSAPIEEVPPKKYVPVVADFLRAAAQEFGLVPQQPRSENASLICERSHKGNEGVLIMPAERLHLRGQQMPSHDAQYD